MATRSKLAVILHADVVGSTALVQIDERVAHERIRDAFQQCSGIISRYGGETHELRGDALLAEFQRPSDAVTAALAIQTENAKLNEEQTDDIRPAIRIGIALGEVVIADDTVTGPGVVLAQRLEQLAVPGGVCVQGSVQESIPKRFPFDYEDLGKQSLKGFDEPVWAFSVTLQAGELLPAPELKTPPELPIERPRRRRAAVVTVALLIFSTGLAIWLKPWNVKPSSSEQPSIAVLAFSNMSNDPTQDYFADGIAEDIITDLSKVSGLFVIARNSSFSYKGKDVPIKTVADALGVRYVLEGSVRRAGDTLRITAQLIDATTDGHLWAERYDGPISDVFALQDAVTMQIIKALSVRLKPEEKAVLASHETNSPQAYEAVLLGMRHLNSVDRSRQEENTGARAQFERAIEFDKNYGRAYAGLAWTHWNDFIWFNRDKADKDRALALVDRSIDLRDTALARSLRARTYLSFRTFGNRLSIAGTGEHDLAVSEMRKAVTIEPQNPDTLAELAYTLVFAGAPEEAAALMLRARRLNPNFPNWYREPTGMAQYLLGDYQGAATEFSEWFKHELIPQRSFIWLAAAQAQQGDVSDAKETLAANIEGGNRPAKGLPLNLLGLSFRFQFKDAAHLEHLLDGLRKAGVREEPE